MSYYGCNSSKETVKPSTRYKLCSLPHSTIQANALVVSSHSSACDTTMPPVVLGNGQYSYFDQDNIYVSHEAIWALGLMQLNCVTTECLVLKYVVQKLLWLTGGSIRLVNVELVHMDPVISKEIFQQNKAHFSIIDDWVCSKIHVKDCIIEILTFLQTKNILKDISSIVKWVRDLEKVDYKFPILNTMNMDCKPNNVNLVPVNYTVPPPEKSTWRTVKTPINSIVASQKLYDSLCSKENPPSSSVNLNKPWIQYDDILLIVVFNNPHYEAIPYIELLYASFFPHILYCGPDYPKQSEFPHLFSEDGTFSRNFIPYGETPAGHAKGAFSYSCLQIASLINFNVKGYFVIADDSIIWLHKLSKFSKDAEWFLPRKEVRIGELRTLRECKLGMCDFFPHWNWWEDYQQSTLSALREMKVMKETSSLFYECYNQLIQLNGAEQRANGAYSDIYYVPQRLANNFAVLSELFLKNQVFVEIAVPTILQCIESPESVQPLEGVQNWELDTRDKPWKYFSAEYIFKKVYYHPVKWSFMNKSNKTEEYKNYLCQNIVPFLFDQFERLH